MAAGVCRALSCRALSCSGCMQPCCFLALRAQRPPLAAVNQKQRARGLQSGCRAGPHVSTCQGYRSAVGERWLLVRSWGGGEKEKRGEKPSSLPAPPLSPCTSPLPSEQSCLGEMGGVPLALLKQQPGMAVCSAGCRAGKIMVNL